MSRVTTFSEWLLRQAFIWGGLACLAFYALVVRGSGEGEFLQRYFAGHPVAYCATALFFVGLAALVIKLLGLSLQFATLESLKLPAAEAEGDVVEDVPALLGGLSLTAPSLQDSYLGSRLHDALQYVQQKGSTDTLENQLHHLEENDLAKMYHGYAMVRIILSTIPILGFLGTVIGITLAIGKMDLAGEAMQQSLPAVVSGLSVAFDTTALALSLSTILLFAKFCVERVEIHLLERVDDNVSRQLVGRFQELGSDKDPHLASVRRISEQLLKTVETGMNKQSSLFEQSLEKMVVQSSEVLANTASTVDEALSGAVVEGLTRHGEALSKSIIDHASALNVGVESHARDLEELLIKHAEILNEGLQHHTATQAKSLEQHTSVLAKSLEHHRTALTEAEKQLAQENRQHLAEVEAAVGEAMIVATSRQEKLIERSEVLLKEMQQALIESAGSTVSQQEQLVKQGDVLLKIVEATGQIRELEGALNNNLNALAGAHGFRETAAGLSAALQVIGARLGQPVALTENQNDLPTAPNQNQAA